MYKKIFKEIKKYDNIVIARHINVDPDALGSQMALKESIKNTFPKKNVFCVGASPTKFNYMGHTDKINVLDEYSNCLLIALDTPDKRRLDIGEFNNYTYSIKIDHHPFLEEYCDLEMINHEKASASEMVYDLISSTPLKMDKKCAEYLFYGIVADTGRFLFNNATPDALASTLKIAASLISDYQLDSNYLYHNLYKRPINELRLQGYMSSNMQVTENGVGYIKITNDVIKKFQIDSVSSGDIINEFNHINELLVWLSATEDVKNNNVRISIRSRGPVINKIAEKYHGGGHKYASGVRVPSYEEVDMIIKDLDKLCDNYLKGCEDNENN